MNESVIVIILFVSVFSWTVFSLWRSVKNRDLLLEEEILREAILIEIGGGRFGEMHYTRPYVKLRLYDDFLVLSYKKNKILLRYDKIDSVNVTGLLHGLQINHNDETQPIKKIIFVSRSPDYLSAIITEKLRAYKKKI